MDEIHLDTVFLMEMFCQMLCCINRTVLPARATEGDHQICESAIQIPFYGSIHEAVHMLEETENLAVIFEEFHNRFIQACEVVILGIFARIVDGAAVEYEASAVARRIGRNAFLVGKADDAYFQRALLMFEGELRQLCQLAQNLAQIGIFGIILL